MKREKRWFVFGGVFAAALVTIAVIAVLLWPAPGLGGEPASGEVTSSLQPRSLELGEIGPPAMEFSDTH